MKKSMMKIALVLALVAGAVGVSMALTSVTGQPAAHACGEDGLDC